MRWRVQGVRTGERPQFCHQLTFRGHAHAARRRSPPRHITVATARLGQEEMALVVRCTISSFGDDTSEAPVRVGARAGSAARSRPPRRPAGARSAGRPRGRRRSARTAALRAMFAALSDLVATAVAAASPRGLEEEQERAEALVDKARAHPASRNARQCNARPPCAPPNAPPAALAARGMAAGVATRRRVASRTAHWRQARRCGLCRTMSAHGTTAV